MGESHEHHNIALTTGFLIGFAIGAVITGGMVVAAS